MFFPGRGQLKAVNVMPVVFFLVFFLAGTASGVETKSQLQKTYKRVRIKKGGDYKPHSSEVYKGDSPCKAGSGIVKELESKFCGFYDHKAAMSQKNNEQEK